MAHLTTDDVLKLAQLAKLTLTETEVTTFKKELDDILGYVEQLSKVDTTGLKPTNQVTGLKNVMRADTIKDYGTSREDLLQNLPDRVVDLIKVKRVL